MIVSTMSSPENRFVSRGGIKLQAALSHFPIGVAGKIVLDAGSSTGGFVDCLLQNGAMKVYAVDTAFGELAWKLRNDPRVVVMERSNILYLPRESIPEDVDAVTIDTGWTMLELTLPAVRKFLKPDARVVALLKPQYEAEKSLLRRGVLPDDAIGRVKEESLRRISDLGFVIDGQMESPILGSGGNREFLLSMRVAKP